MSIETARSAGPGDKADRDVESNDHSHGQPRIQRSSHGLGRPVCAVDDGPDGCRDQQLDSRS